MSFEIGATVGGKYRIMRVLGQGGMGTVFLARHLLLETDVALKLLRVEESQQLAASERLIREGRALARLRGKHIARVLDVEASSGGPCFLVLEYLDGEDLGSIVSRTGPLQLDVAVSYVLQACEGLGEAHAHGIVHRDIKPSNLFLTTLADGSRGIKVIDFGISKDVDGGSTLTHSRAIIGSPWYMAPEQMRAGAQVDERADIWSLGIVLFELLTGKVPYRGDTVLEICAAILESPAPSIKKLRPDLPDAIDAVVRRCLTRDPERRFGTASELARAIVQCSGASTGRLAWILPRGHSAYKPSPSAAVAGSRAEERAGETQSEAPPTRSWRRPAIVFSVVGLGVSGLLGFLGAGRFAARTGDSAAPARASLAVEAAPLVVTNRAKDNSGLLRAESESRTPVVLPIATSERSEAGPPSRLPAPMVIEPTAPGLAPISPGASSKSSHRPRVGGTSQISKPAGQTSSTTKGRPSESGTQSDPVLQYGHY